jgi:hypothetical protein
MSEPSVPEVIERPDLDAVLADERNREIIEEYESSATARSSRSTRARRRLGR